MTRSIEEGRRGAPDVKRSQRRPLSPLAEHRQGDVWRARIGMSLVVAVFVASAAVVRHLIPA